MHAAFCNEGLAARRPKEMRTARKPLYPARTSAEVNRPIIAYDPTTCESEKGLSSVPVDGVAGGVPPEGFSDAGSACKRTHLALRTGLITARPVNRRVAAGLGRVMPIIVPVYRLM